MRSQPGLLLSGEESLGFCVEHPLNFCRGKSSLLGDVFECGVLFLAKLGKDAIEEAVPLFRERNVGSLEESAPLISGEIQLICEPVYDVWAKRRVFPMEDTLHQFRCYAPRALGQFLWCGIAEIENESKGAYEGVEHVLCLSLGDFVSAKTIFSTKVSILVKLTRQNGRSAS